MKPLILTIFGITSNLAQIKLIPALYDLEEKDLLPEEMKILGVARSPQTRQDLVKFFDKVLHTENRHHQHPIKPEVLKRLSVRLYYLDGHLEDSKFYPELENKLHQLEPNQKDILYYLATYPSLYQTIFEHLQANGLNKEESGWVRLMIEKPIGNDLKSAKALNQLLLRYFKESQIFRLDHYLGKETLQNILTFRFGNNIFEHLINKDYVDHIQVTMLEDFGIGKRGGYFDQVGALKDVGQNHLLQMLAFACMDQPSKFTNQAVTKERIKFLKRLIPDPKRVVFGQYKGYQDEEKVDPHSQTDTYFAFKTKINSDRFKNVPVYIRSGKMLKQTVAEISIVFKEPQDCLFEGCGMSPNILIYRIQPNEGIVLNILTKTPGHEIKLEPTYMQFCYRDLGQPLSDPYEKLIADTIRGDQTFFNDAEEVEIQWAFTDPLFQAKTTPIEYQPGTYGPQEADQLIEADGRKWLEPSMLFCRI